jgi:hypothetical protein
MKTIKVEHFGEIPRGFTGIAEWADGRKEWILNGELHRVDGPAIEYAYGSKSWWLNGKRHRVDGPAIEWADGSKEWWLNGKHHREDGPAVEFTNGRKAWYLNDNRVFTLEPIGEYIVIEDGLPSTMEWLGEPVPTLKVLTAEGIKYIPNLPGI